MNDLLTIEKGASDWQIFQQNNGFADITIGGKFKKETHNYKNCIPCVKLVSETNGMIIFSWQQANITGENEWEYTFKNVPCGGLYRIESRLKTDDTKPMEMGGSLIGQCVHHIGVGDNILVAGQSNAAGIGRGVSFNPPNINVHVLRNLDHWDIATDMMHDMRSINTPALACAKTIQAMVNYPIGIIPCALGGVPITRWLKDDENGDLYREAIKLCKDNNIGIKAIIWYQGETDATPERRVVYYDRFKKMVNDFRQDLGNPKLPIFTAQLNRVCTCLDHETFSWDVIRDIQRKAAKEIENVFVIPTVDSFKLSDAIHNSMIMNQMIGERMALQMLCELYGKINFKVPDIASAKKIDDCTVEYRFDNVISSLFNFYIGNTQYAIVAYDDDGDIETEEFNISKNVVTAKYKRPIGKNAKAKCEYSGNPRSILFDTENQLPVLAFYDYPIE